MIDTKSGWLLEHEFCRACGGYHDIFLTEEPERPFNIVYTCPDTETSTRLMHLESIRPVECQPADSLLAIQR